jgi:hypothetical protein
VFPLVAVAVVDVRLVGVFVDELPVPVEVGVVAPAVERRVAGGVVVGVVAVVVAVAVLVHLCGVPVGVAVLLEDEQPGAEGHQGHRQQKEQVRLLGEEQHGEGHPEEGGHG